MKAFAILTLMASVLFFSACEEKVKIKPDPPAGSFVYGDKLNEVGREILQLDDGNFLLVGGKQDPEGYDYDITLTKIDPNGGELWTKVFRDENSEEYGLRILKIDQGYALLTATNSGDYFNASMSISFLDEDFVETKRRVIGNPANGYGIDELAPGFFRLSNGGYMIPATQFNQFYLIRTDENGQLDEPTTLPISAYSYASNTIAQKPNGGFALATQDGNGSFQSLNIHHFDDLANFTTTSTVQLQSNAQLEIKRLSIAPDGSYYLSVSDFGYNPRLIHLDSAGNLYSDVALGDNLYWNFVFPRPDSSIVLAGGYSNYWDSGIDLDANTMTVDANGNPGSTTTFGGSKSEKMRSAYLTPGGKLYLLGQTQSFGQGGTDMYLVIQQF